MRGLRPAGISLRPSTLVAVALVAAVYLWFWTVAAHRINDPPFVGFLGVFQTGCGDFEHFYLAARAMRDGSDLYGSGMRGYIYPPLIAFLFMPLTFVSVQVAAWVMLVVNLALMLLCTWVASAEAVRRFGTTASFHNVMRVVAVATLLSATRLRSELQMWQTDVLLMTAVLLAWRFLDARPQLAGLLLGLAVNIKYLPLVFLPYLLFRRRFVAAAWFVAGIVAFALLPALHTGWGANLHHWATASSGLARLFGFSATATTSANVDPITAGYSISITSGIARILGAAAAPGVAWLATACVALVLAWVLRGVYAARGKPLMAWPPARGQGVQPYLGTVALEWPALMTVALAFSPQTNPRHTSLLLMVFAPLAVMLCFPRPGTSRGAAVLATVILFLGLALPPKLPEFALQVTWWAQVGGVGWCMAAMLPFFFIAGFRQLDSRTASRTSGRTRGATNLGGAAAVP